MREPTPEELGQLLNWHLERQYGENHKLTYDEIEDERLSIRNASICVFPNYITDGPGYSGRVMVVVWSGDPTFVEAFVWYQDKLIKLSIEV